MAYLIAATALQLRLRRVRCRPKRSSRRRQAVLPRQRLGCFLLRLLRIERMPTGLGAVYNGQYVKGVVHAAIFGMLIAISTTADHAAVPALMVPMVVFFVLYMPIEAVRTAQAMRRGEEVKEMSGIVGALFDANNDSPVPGILFVALGVFFLLLTLGVLRAELVFKAWPLIIVGLGVWRLYASTRKREELSRYEQRATSYDLPE
jgi:hypothetical protein